MSAYAIFIRERIRNAGELQTYAEMVSPLLGSRMQLFSQPTALRTFLRGPRRKVW